MGHTRWARRERRPGDGCVDVGRSALTNFIQCAQRERMDLWIVGLLILGIFVAALFSARQTVAKAYRSLSRGPARHCGPSLQLLRALYRA